ncbi:hypothetical protein [Reinekea marinisedimentorum]|uniref:Uncharacterized protein n=1 Tax=Reinekea marinisedimentorum TaxID=230495 RepID=A0A4R3I8M9_9GAMM|nr:hypothetical protein [Reinekea marinisedimentorum]TCS41356.1 hypothetical protein BCF53_10687 [Reinekea marinisedimentorum]
MNRAPDIEIYVPKITAGEAADWLTEVFTHCELGRKKKGMPKNAQPVYVQWQSQKIFGVIYEQVVNGYTSIWLDSNELPWPSDKECAHSAAEYFNRPVRFVEDSWQQQQDPDAWQEVSENGETQSLIWKT